MNVEAIARFEKIARQYINGNERIRETILLFFDDSEKQVFLESVGFYRLFTDQRYYNAVRNAVGKQLYEELHTAP